MAYLQITRYPVRRWISANVFLSVRTSENQWCLEWCLSISLSKRVGEKTVVGWMAHQCLGFAQPQWQLCTCISDWTRQHCRQHTMEVRNSMPTGRIECYFSSDVGVQLRLTCQSVWSACLQIATPLYRQCQVPDQSHEPTLSVILGNSETIISIWPELLSIGIFQYATSMCTFCRKDYTSLQALGLWIS